MRRWQICRSARPPDIVHVVPEMALSASYRPLISPLRAMGVPKPSRNAWYLDTDTSKYKRLTAAVRAEILERRTAEVVLGVRRAVRLAAHVGSTTARANALEDR